jgi:hypothetical protein
LAALLGCADSTSPNPNTNSHLSDLSTMNVGDVRVITLAQATNGLTIPSTLSSAQYLIVAANVRGDAGSVPNYHVSANQQLATPTLENSLSVPSPFAHPIYSRRGGSFGAQFEAKLRSYERQHLYPAAYRARKVSPTMSPLLRADHVPYHTVPTVGQQYQFNVPGSGADPCSNFSTVTATVQSVSNHAIIVVDTTAHNNGFTTATYDSVANDFDTWIYPTESGYFGPPTDVDSNGHVFILFTPQVNLATPAGQANTQGYVGGFTFIGDFFPATSETSGGCPESNQGEIFYLMVPDPTGQFGNVFSAGLVRQQTSVTMAHELQHAINYGNRLVNNAFPNGFESAWLDEALSSLAEDAVGRAKLGDPDLQKFTLDTILHMDAATYNTFFSENFGRLQIYVLRPDTVGAIVSDTREEQDLAAFGAGWAFLRYTVDWFSNNAPRTLTAALVAGPDTGIANLTQHTGVPLDTLLAHWLVTLYTDGQNIPGLPAQYNYRSYSMRDIVSDLTCSGPGCNGLLSYLPVTAVGDGTTSVTIGIPSSSADYFLTSKVASGTRTFTIANSGAATFDPYIRLYVVRVQ